MHNKTKELAYVGLGTAIALILSYIESLLPPIFTAVPGIKLGLPNIIIIFILFRVGFGAAATVSFVRVCLSGLLFGSVMTFAYSLVGAGLSLCVMAFLKKIDKFSMIGISISGGVVHNFGQILVAIFVFSTSELMYYMIPLTISGIIAGIFVGIVAALMLKYIKRI